MSGADNPHDYGSSSNSLGASRRRDGDETEVFDAGARGVRRVIKPAAVCSTKDGTVIDLPIETVRAVNDFMVPAGYRREGSSEKSFMYSLGVYAKPVDPHDSAHKYFCLASPSCRNSRRIVKCSSGDRSNVNTHLKKAHDMCGAQSFHKSDKKKAQQTTIIEKNSVAGSKNQGVETNRVRELMALKLLIENFLPFTFFSSGTAWEELMAVLTSTSAAFPIISARRVKHLIVEAYVATKQAVVGNMVKDIKKAPLPIFHHGMDIWACRTSGRKFLGIHGFYVDSGFILRKVLLSVKHYAPSAELRESEKASQALFTILKATLAEHGVEISDLAGGTTDSDPDVKAMCTKILFGQYGIPCDRSACSVADKAVENAFFTSATPQQPKNKDAREILDSVIKMASKINQSSTFNQWFERLHLEALEDIFNITEHTPQQWLNLIRTFERIIRLWHVFRKLYVDNGGQFPLDDEKDVILQLFSLLEPLAAITRDSQLGDVPMTAEVYMAIAVLHSEVLNPVMPLEVFDVPASPGSSEEEQLRGQTDARGEGKGKGTEGREKAKEKKPLPSKKILADQLHPVTVKTRRELRKALVQRFVGRVWDTDADDPSPFRNATALLTPPFNAGNFLYGLRLSAEDAEFLPDKKRHLAPTPDSDVAIQISDSWAGIQERALAAAKAQEKRSAHAAPEGSPPMKRFCATVPGSQPERRDRFASFGRTAIVGGNGQRDGDGGRGQDVLAAVVKGEVISYQALFMETSELDCRDVLGWWGTTGKAKFPYLAPVAQQAFGNQAHAAKIDRDFSACGNLLGPGRSRMDTYWVEMVMYLKANFELIPDLKHIPMIAAKDLGARIPARFKGEDADLIVAEAALDVLDNSQIPTVDGLDLDK